MKAQRLCVLAAMGILALLPLLTARGATPAAAASGTQTRPLASGGWVSLPNPNSGTNQAEFGVACPGATTCYLVGPALWRTTDGGTNWTVQIKPGDARINRGSSGYAGLYGVTCTSVSTCWAVGTGLTFLTTTNGGRAWTAQTQTTGGIFGGTGADMYAVSCSSTSTCIAAGAHGTIMRGYDGGTDWVSSDSPNNPDSGTTHNELGVACPSDSVCYVVGYRILGSSTVDQKANATWSVQRGRASLYSIACPNVSTCYAVGLGGAIMATTNGGSTWTRQQSGTTRALHGVSCTGATTCVAVGAAGTIVVTTDGGHTWSPRAGGTTHDLYGVSCAATGACMAVGLDGTVLSGAIPTSASGSTGGSAPAGTQPHIAIIQAFVAQSVNGSLKVTTVVTAGKTFAVFVHYAVQHKGANTPRATVIFARNGQDVLQGFTELRKTSSGQRYVIGVGELSQPGQYVAKVTIFVGTATAHTAVPFTVQ